MTPPAPRNLPHKVIPISVYKGDAPEREDAAQKVRSRYMNFTQLAGVLLWSLLNRRRMIGAGIALVSLTAVVSLALQAM